MIVSYPPVFKKTAIGMLKLAVLGGAVVSLSGCGGVQGALGLGKSPPDEFAVVTKAPLIVPPDFSLRPPRPGSPRPQELQPTETARRALLGEDFGEGQEGPSQGEVSLLMKAGADRVDPNIRQVLADESGKSRRKDEGFTDTILFWRDNETGSNTTRPLNASAETERLRDETADAVGGEDDQDTDAEDD